MASAAHGARGRAKFANWGVFLGISSVACVLALAVGAHGGRMRSDFLVDGPASISDTSRVGILGSSLLRLSVDTVYFAQGLDTLLSFGREWNGAVNSNDRGALPLVQSVGQGLFHSLYLSYSSVNSSSPYLNRLYMIRVDLDSARLTVRDTLAGNLHTNSPPVFFQGATSVRPLPAFLEMESSLDRHVAHWATERAQGQGPILRSHWRFSIPGHVLYNPFDIRGRYLREPEGALPATLSTTEYVVGRLGVLNSQAFARLDADYNEIFLMHGPRYQGDHRIYLRWERVESPLIHHIDSITPTDVGTASTGPGAIAYHLAAATDGVGHVVAAWTEGASGSKLWLRAYDPARVQMGVDLLAVDGIDTRAAADGYYRTYALRHLSGSSYLLLYAQSGVVYRRTLTLNPGGLVVGGATQVNLPGTAVSYPDVAVNAGHVAVTFWRAVGASRRPEVVRFERAGASLGDTLVRSYSRALPFTVLNSDPSYRLHGRNIVSVAVDSSGNVLTGFNDDKLARIAAFSNRNFYYPTGYFQSAPLVLAAPGVGLPWEATDSVRFEELSLYARGTGVQARLQASAAGNFTDAAFLAVDTVAGLQPVRPVQHAFRYRIDLSSAEAGFATPAVDSVVLRWNLQPRAPSLLTVQVGDAGAVRPFSVDSVYTVVNRRDSLSLTLEAWDLDNPDSLQIQVRLGSAPWLRSSGDSLTAWLPRTAPGTFSGTLVLPARDTVGLVSADVRASDGRWVGPARTLRLRYRNEVPRDSLHLRWLDGRGVPLDSTLNSGDAVRIQVNDSARFQIWWSDPNDAALQVSWTLHGPRGVRQGDSSLQGVPGTTVVVLEPDPWDSDPSRIPGGDSLRRVPDTLRVVLRDPDTALVRTLLLWPNHQPRLDSLSSVGTVVGGDTTWRLLDRARAPWDSRQLTVAPGVVNLLSPGITEIDAGDSVRTLWHALWINAQTGICCVDSALGDDALSAYLFPPEQPTLLRLRLEDRTGAAREDTFAIRFPRMDTTTGAWGLSLSILQDSLSFVLGSGRTRDTVIAELRNRGNQVLHITGIRTGNDQAAWLQYSVQSSAGQALQVRDQTDSSRWSVATPFALQPDQSLQLRFVVNVGTLRGDSAVGDTLFVTSDDFRFPLLRIPLRARWDDLPQLRMYRRPQGILDTVWTRDSLQQYFPAFSSLFFVFSEPVDSRNIAQHLQIYSRLDSMARGVVGISPIDPQYSGGYRIHYTRLANGSLSSRWMDSLEFAPFYRTASDHFGVMPPPRNFVHSDVLGIRLSNAITDSAGNALDLRGDRERLVAGSLDTVLIAHLDTSVLRVVRSWPEEGGIHDPDDPVRLLFNHPLALYNLVSGDSVLALDRHQLQGDSNSTFRFVTRFSAGQGVALRAPYLERGDSVLVLAPLRKFISGDSVTLTLASTVSDVFGRTLDGNGDGVFAWPPLTSDDFVLRFTTGSKKFYTFPNPYRASERAHREKGGITFKNLHQIKGLRAGRDIDVRIFTPDGILVYWTHRAGVQLRLSASVEPSFDWDLRNLAGNPVASGVYLYTIGHGHTVHRKGKVMVIR